jgi:serine/threonine-protein kinase
VLDKRYRIVGLLGRGGMGEVYRADDLKLGQPVALKFLPAGLDRDENRLNRFLNEVRTARQVTHFNVCRVFDIDEVDGQHYLSMEYVDGEDLSSLLRRIGRLPKDKAMQIARQLCAGVQAAHEQGILHRDLKPANVMVDGRGQVKITDFGLAGLEETIQDGEIRSGTPAYMAPEQLAGKEVTVRSDIYALGLVLYELFTGKQAFEAATPTELVRLHRDSAPTNPSSHVEGFDPAVERAILRCLEKEPGDRPNSALAVSAALPGGDPLAAALAAGETPSPEMVAEAGEAAALNPAFAAGIAVFGVAVIVLGGWLEMGDRVRTYLDLDKSPEVLADRAQEVIRKLGFTEPVYSDPADSAFGIEERPAMLDRIRDDDQSSNPREALRDARLGPVTFWYRQSAAPIVATSDPYKFYRFGQDPVSKWSPFPRHPGDIVVSLDLRGRLLEFLHTPSELEDVTAIGVAHRDDRPPANWLPAFELAEIDPAVFEPVAARTRGHVDPEARAAWIGRLPDVLSGDVRIEAGMSQGRIVLFRVLDEAAVELASSKPEKTGGVGIGALTEPAIGLPLVIAAVFVARRNVRRGRADMRGATRIAAVVFCAAILENLLLAHRLFSQEVLVVVWPAIGAGVFMGSVVFIFYLAVEPGARRVWPTMLLAGSRLVSGPTIRLRDPRVGRSVLAGLIAGGLVLLALPLANLIVSAVGRSPVDVDMLLGYSWLGPRYVAQQMSFASRHAIVLSFALVLVLVLARLLFRRTLPAALAAGAIYVLAYSGGSLIGVLFASILAAIMLGVMVRSGVVALVVTHWIASVMWLHWTRDFDAWHGQAAMMTLAAVVLLAAYGYWASTAGWVPSSESSGRQVPS